MLRTRGNLIRQIMCDEQQATVLSRRIVQKADSQPKYITEWGKKILLQEDLEKLPKNTNVTIRLQYIQNVGKMFDERIPTCIRRTCKSVFY